MECHLLAHPFYFFFGGGGDLFQHYWVCKGS